MKHAKRHPERTAAAPLAAVTCAPAAGAGALLAVVDLRAGVRGVRVLGDACARLRLADRRAEATRVCAPATLEAKAQAGAALPVVALPARDAVTGVEAVLADKAADPLRADLEFGRIVTLCQHSSNS